MATYITLALLDLLQVLVHGLGTVVGTVRDGTFCEVRRVDAVHRGVLVSDDLTDNEASCLCLPQQLIEHVPLCSG